MNWKSWLTLRKVSIELDTARWHLGQLFLHISIEIFIIHIFARSWSWISSPFSTSLTSSSILGCYWHFCTFVWPWRWKGTATLPWGILTDSLLAIWIVQIRRSLTVINIGSYLILSFPYINGSDAAISNSDGCLAITSHRTDIWDPRLDCWWAVRAIVCRLKIMRLFLTKFIHNLFVQLLLQLNNSKLFVNLNYCL